MTTTATDIFDELQWRGLIALSTDLDALRAAAAEGPLTFYVGFDPTASSLHIGSLVQILTIKRLQRAGHRPLVLVGGATGLIGDPKPTAERVLNDPSVVADWVDQVRAQIEPYLEFEGSNAATMVNNLDWTAPLSAIDFLRNIGKYFRVNRMLAKDAVSTRLKSDAGISYTEFSYQILQGMDFLELYQRYGCLLQLGGSDQWGNLTAGLDLIRQAAGVTAHALATPLITKSDGTKFGKTEGGTIWINGELTSPYAFYQFWLNADDRDVVTYLKVFTDRTREEIDALAEATSERPAAREAQRALAADVTDLVHGRAAREQAVAASLALFGRGDIGVLDEPTLGAALAEAGVTELSAPLPTVAEAFREAGLSKSLSDARRTVKEGGAYVNNERVTDADAALNVDELLHGRYAVLRRGRKAIAGISVTS